MKKHNMEGYTNIVLVDDFTDPLKNKNLVNKLHTGQVPRGEFFDWLPSRLKDIEFIFHIGARTDTTLFDKSIFDELNLNYSKRIWETCEINQIPLVYASSAATYGAGELGYRDDHAIIPDLKPLNPYGESKQEFDKWVLQQTKTPPFWAGLKFFNVYGPNEYHKGRMASVVFHAFNQIKESGKLKLFRSHKEEYADGMQLRDFIYVMDVVDVCFYLMKKRPGSAIYNVGTGKANSFNALAKAIFKAMVVPVKIEYIDIPEDIRENYQYFTKAEMEKLKNTSYPNGFQSLQDGIDDYFSLFLAKESPFF